MISSGDVKSWGWGAGPRLGTWAWTWMWCQRMYDHYIAGDNLGVRVIDVQDVGGLRNV